MTDLVVPALGESITEAVVARWLKNVGDTVTADEPVVDLETDKITVQLPAPVAGALIAQSAQVGETVKVGQVVGALDPAAAGKAAPKAAAPKVEPPKTAPPAVQPPRPAAPQAPAPRPSAPTASAGSAGAQAAPVAAAPKAAPPPALDEDALMKLSPSQRRIARERGELPATATATATATSPAAAPVQARPAAPPIKLDPRDEVVAMSPLRKRVAERLVQAQQETASLTTFNEVDMTAVMELRSRYKDSFEKAHGVKLGFMSFFVRACYEACKKFPGINAEVAGDSIVYKKHYDFGIAVQTPKGLVVPVLRDVDQLGFAEIEAGIGALAEKARTGKLAIDDLVGGTFSISNGGIYGSMMSTPLLNYPQTGILGMHNIVKRAVVIDDQIQVRPMMYLALTYDHRVVDGREAVSFLVAVKERLESPERLLLAV